MGGPFGYTPEFMAVVVALVSSKVPLDERQRCAHGHKAAHVTRILGQNSPLCFPHGIVWQVDEKQSEVNCRFWPATIGEERNTGSKNWLFEPSYQNLTIGSAERRWLEPRNIPWKPEGLQNAARELPIDCPSSLPSITIALPLIFDNLTHETMAELYLHL
ncbi:hypothetical protein Nepgr_009906 [Nepenthes gracilis]|uniref:Uncharacterized protein n=1 Tax=Nepenthes gracilis TaxID=150966 RepID=A0AAD3SBY9_NEPGR|nr:hypothetical protein Nepgr_009906 [Nepenthes gracilis]